MRPNTFAGPLLRILRLKKNWSQETLCRGICTVSYISKIEQGKAEPNDALLKDLFSRLGSSWVTDREWISAQNQLCEHAYETAAVSIAGSVLAMVVGAMGDVLDHRMTVTIAAMGCLLVCWLTIWRNRKAVEKVYSAE